MLASTEIATINCSDMLLTMLRSPIAFKQEVCFYDGPNLHCTELSSLRELNVACHFSSLSVGAYCAALGVIISVLCNSNIHECWHRQKLLHKTWEQGKYCLNLQLKPTDSSNR